MRPVDQITDALMAPGGPFEVVKQDDIRVFKHAARDLAEVLNRSRQFGSAEFIVLGERRLTYDDFFAAVDALAAHLIHEHNITPGQSVAICMKNAPEWMIGFVAVILAGGVAVLINSRGEGTTMRTAIEDADSVLVLTDNDRAQKLKKAGCSVPLLDGQDFPTQNRSYQTPERETTDIVTMFFTSGTTGRAKAAAISHRALVTGMMSTQMAMVAVFQKMAAEYGVDVETLRQQMPQSCSILIFPLFHASGCGAVFLTSMSMGGKLVLMDRWDGTEAVRLIEKERITTFGGVPTMHWDLLRSPEFQERDLSSLMAISCGGQALPINLLEEIRAAFPRAIIGAGYGMTEMSGAISQSTGAGIVDNPTASGQILPMTDVKIVDDAGAELAVGETGEIWTKGATMMSGYYGRPEDTAKAFEDGWYKTGDIGRLDENGFIYIIDRKTDMVISGGENIYCVEVEQALVQHPNVLSVTTFGVADDRLGEKLIAVFQMKNPDADKEDLMAFAKAHLADYKVPADIAISTRPFELNAMGKVIKAKVRQAYLSGEF